MGLDMYLFRRNKNAQPYTNENGYEEYDREEVAYWRKANEIHQWFIDSQGLDPNFNCEYAEVDENDLQELIDTCELVLKHRNSIDAIEIAESHLPTQGGFFFGSTDYDEYYYDHLKDTIEQLESVIENTDWDNEIVEYSCWW